MAGRDGRAVSETAGVAVLVLMTVAVTASVGISVMIATDNSNNVDAEFSFELAGDRLIITHEGGSELEADQLYIDGPANNLTWAQNVGADDDDGLVVGTDNLTQIGSNAPYGSGVGGSEIIEIVYVGNGNGRTVIASSDQES